MSPSPAATWATYSTADADARTVPEDFDPRRTATVLRDLANPCRFGVLSMLCEGEQCVGVMGARLGLSQSALSQHLGRLRQARLVTTRRAQQRVFYSLASPELRPLIHLIAEGCAQLSAHTRRERPGRAGRHGFAVAAE